MKQVRIIALNTLVGMIAGALFCGTMVGTIYGLGWLAHLVVPPKVAEGIGGEWGLGLAATLLLIGCETLGALIRYTRKDSDGRI